MSIKKIILSAAKKDFVGFQSFLESIVEEKFRDALDVKVDEIKSTLFAEAKDEDEDTEEEEDADGKDSEDDKKDEDNGKKKKENPFAKKD